MQNTHARTHTHTHTHTHPHTERVADTHSLTLTHARSALVSVKCVVFREKKKWALFPLFKIKKLLFLSFFLSFFTRVCAHSVEDEAVCHVY